MPCPCAAGLVDAARAVGGKTVLVDAAPSDDYAARLDEVLRGKSGERLPTLF